MATIKVKDDLYSSAAYGNLDSDERALFWELLGMTRFGEMIRIEDAAYKLRRPADAKPCRSVKQSIQILERAGLVHVEDGRLEVVSAFAWAHSNAQCTAKSRAKKAAAESLSPTPASTAMAPAPAPAEPIAPKKKRTTQVSRAAIPASVKFEIPEGIDPAIFQRFLEVRAQNVRKVIVQEMADRWSKDLEALRATGADLNNVVQYATSQGWQNFFPAPKIQGEPGATVAKKSAFVGSGAGQVNPNASRGRLVL